jgi:hypothetical protein
VERTPSVAGVEVACALPGRVGAWRGRADRAMVDVTVLVLGPDPAIRRAALAALTPLVGRGGGLVPRCREVLACRDGVALVADAVDGRRLSELPPLTPGHAVAVGRPVAAALEALHARGLAWGGDLGELLVDATGGVRLPYERLAARRVGGEVGSTRGDVAALASLLAARCPDPHLAALAADPPADAAALARALRRRARPRRLLLRAAPEPAAPQGRRRRTVLAVGGAAALVAAATVGWASVRDTPHSGPAPAPLARPAAAPVDWTATLQSLDARRAVALTGSASLATVDAPSSPALAADTATRARLAAAHLSVVAPTPSLQAVRAQAVGADVATLAVTDVLAGYVYRDMAGRVAASAPARGAHTWTVVLRRTTAGWRFVRVS